MPNLPCDSTIVEFEANTMQFAGSDSEYDRRFPWHLEARSWEAVIVIVFAGRLRVRLEDSIEG